MLLTETQGGKSQTTSRHPRLQVSHCLIRKIFGRQENAQGFATSPPSRRDEVASCGRAMMADRALQSQGSAEAARNSSVDPAQASLERSLAAAACSEISRISRFRGGNRQRGQSGRCLVKINVDLRSGRRSFTIPRTAPRINFEAASSILP
ncbi:PAK1IP1 protein [Pseudozyma hubeiensis SY62]|uniref:PAK1IP1 protein n=1 Tax=Pseudozyma hubeiensis (strain SY62) TaxID=1305764 RepID=R9P954_PSEHS|nr:PAK1IP1 protein [Pseudozyma hubeiensis SY62]GAC97864.1 PAK1IP1 protein [Pseudozyma hubeiensis SY62]